MTLETDLFQPVKEYLERLGYHVGAEVKDCDIAAIRGDDLVIVELKVSANITLLIQATERQKMTDAVYVALPEPARRSSHFRGVERLLKRLGLGLMTVRFGPLGAAADIRFDPLPGTGKREGRKRAALLREISGRSREINTGGSTGTPIMTAYRETALYIACCLEQSGPCTTRELRRLGAGEKCASILAKNYYGWFERVSRGKYRVTPLGIRETRKYPDLRARALALSAGHDSPT